MTTATPASPFSSLYRVDLTTGCWVWQRALDRKGYGHIRREGKVWLAHRWSYRLAHRSIPSELTIDHLCFNPACVNPAHMTLATLRANASRNRVSLSHFCRRGHRRTPETTAERTDWKGRAFRRCLLCERAATTRNRRNRDQEATA